MKAPSPRAFSSSSTQRCCRTEVSVMRWPKKLICLWRGTRCTVLRLGLEGGMVEISYKGKSKLVPEEKIEIIKEDGK